jgi:anti-sigma factor RsiW
MKTPPDETQIVRFLDGQMEAAELADFEQQLQSDTKLRAEVETMREISALVRTHVPRERAVPNADFFNSQILAEIGRDMNPVPREKPAATGWLDWLRMPWLAGAAAAVALAGALWLQRDGGVSVGAESVVLSSYVPNPAIQARVYHSQEANATVLMLEGLDEIPAEKTIKGVAVHRTETDTEVATTTLFSESGEVLLVLAKDARNQPRLLVR